MSASEPSAAAEQYNDDSFWEKLKGHAQVAGESVVRQALELYYSSKDPATPLWAKNIIYGALAYLILPADAIPDVLPVVGFTDDLGVITAALAAIVSHVGPDTKAKADSKLRDWFSR
jgi:uncharacterized membrane protein YkvA (DUF1232 family)